MAMPIATLRQGLVACAAMFNIIFPVSKSYPSVSEGKLWMECQLKAVRSKKSKSYFLFVVFRKMIGRHGFYIANHFLSFLPRTFVDTSILICVPDNLIYTSNCGCIQ